MVLTVADMGAAMGIWVLGRCLAPWGGKALTRGTWTQLGLMSVFLYIPLSWTGTMSGGISTLDKALLPDALGEATDLMALPFFLSACCLAGSLVGAWIIPVRAALIPPPKSLRPCKVHDAKGFLKKCALAIALTGIFIAGGLWKVWPDQNRFALAGFGEDGPDQRGHGGLDRSMVDTEGPQSSQEYPVDHQRTSLFD